MPKYDVSVQLTGTDGNAFSILAKVSKALKQIGAADQVKQFYDEATSGDYNHLLRTCAQWVKIK